MHNEEKATEPAEGRLAEPERRREGGPQEGERAEARGSEPAGPAETGEAGPEEGDPAGEARVRFEADQESPEAFKAKYEAVKALVAEKVREDSRERALTPDDVIADLDIDLRYGKIDVADLLTEIAADERYLDIKAITTVTGLVFAYSDSYLPDDEALAKSVVEEAKFILASAIRADSLDKMILTPVSELYAMAPDADPAIIDVLLTGMPSEARYADIQKATAADGAVYYHSDTYLTASYAATLMLAMAGDHFVTIAETIREESRIYPRTTNVTIFRDQGVYGIPAGDLDTVLWNLLRKPEYADIKRIVHPVTRAIHLYSSTYINEASAWAMMDWEEVGRANNP